ncbi:MAG: hypothetical protein FVQ77_08255 [Cytophagales bacterium]|nr:hypothetical protein [Cytophagales bacterium]
MLLVYKFNRTTVTKNIKDTAELLCSIAKKYPGNNKLYKVRALIESGYIGSNPGSTCQVTTTPKKSFPVFVETLPRQVGISTSFQHATSLQKQKNYFLEGLPGIGRNLSKRLANHFKSIESIINAPADELTKIKGISLKGAGLIKKFLKS